MPAVTPLMDRLGLDTPIIQAPMAGASTPALAAASSSAGALGSLGAATLDPDALGTAIRDIRAATAGPFNINLLLIPPPETDEAVIEAMRETLRPHYIALGINPDTLPPLMPPPFGFDDQLDVVVREQAPVFSFAFGIPEPDALARAREAGSFIIGTATSAAEARALQDAGVDAVVAQGAEAGGHRGTFAPEPTPDFDAGMAPLETLVGDVIAAVDLPVIASGGITDGAQVSRLVALGAQAVQIGTLFLACTENEIAPGYRAGVLAGGETVITRAYTGRPARALRTAFTDALEDAEIPPFPIQALLTAPLREAAARQGERYADYLPMLAGAGVGAGGGGAAQDVIGKLTDPL